MNGFKHVLQRHSGIVILTVLLVLTFVALYLLRNIILPFLVGLVLAYIFAASYLLDHYLIWIGIISQIAFMVATFTVMYIIKYVLKSKDFEYTYKLATTDGLTDLFNHRYFQEKLKEHMNKADKSGILFSLVLIDIDHFKKFNDT